MPVPGVELLAAAAVGYLVRKARRVAGQVDVVVDQALDEGLDSLQRLVTSAVGGDPAVDRLMEQARTGAETERTVRRAADAIAEAADEDSDFAVRLRRLIEQLEQRSVASGATAADNSFVAGRDVVQHAETGGIIGRDFSGPVTTTVNPSSPDPAQMA